MRKFVVFMVLIVGTGPVVLAPHAGLAASAASLTLADCPTETAVQPGRWLVTSTRAGEPPVQGRADILRLDGGCILLERLVLHFEDGTSHHVVFVQGWDPTDEVFRRVQIGDHPLFLRWEQQSTSPEMYYTVRNTRRGAIELRWRVTPRPEGFHRELLVRRNAESEWRLSETMTYTPLGNVADVAALPPLAPGPFHDPGACDVPAFRAMDYLLGHWFNEEWVRDENGTWKPETVSEVSVEPVIGGCALLETHPIYDDGLLTRRLLLLRGYDAATDRWRQVVFDDAAGVWEWNLKQVEDGWLLTPAEGEMEERLRIYERPGAAGLTKTIETLGEDGTWHTRRLIRYVPW